MKKGTRFITLLFYIFLTSSASFGQAVNGNYQTGKIIFQVKEDALVFLPADEKGMVSFREVSFLQGLAGKYQITGVSQKHPGHENISLRRTYEIDFTNIAASDELVRELVQLGFVKYAQKKIMYKALYTPNDTYYATKQWSLTKINAEAAWAVSKGSSTIVIAVIDNGIDINHPDLQAKISPKSYDIADRDYNPSPPANISAWDHGTHTAGIAGAVTDNSTGIASIGFNCSIMAIKATSDTTKNTSIMPYSNEGIVYAADHGARVISCSFGATASPALVSYDQTVIDYAYNKGCVIVAAAGNSSNQTMVYPAAANHVISVASTGSADVLSSFSNFGTWVTLCAPGEGIFSTITNHTGGISGINYYDYMDGTSMAAPLVSGLCALMLSTNPNLSPAQIISCLKGGCDNIDASNPGYTGKLGSGRINALKAMQCASTTSTPPVADFASNATEINAGSAVNFFDLSSVNPTSYLWSFTGGTPSTSSSANPTGIVYNTPGCYSVTLSVTNNSSSNSITKTCFINVTPGKIITTCDTINNLKLGDTLTAYTMNPPKDGWISGTNVHGERAMAEIFPAPPSGYKVTGVGIYFLKTIAAQPGNTMDINIWSDVGGKPGKVLATRTLTIQSIGASGFSTAKFVNVTFDSPVTVNGKYYAGVQFTAAGNPADTVVVVTNTYSLLKSRINTAWQMAGAVWYSDSTIFGVKLTHLITSDLCSQAITTSVNELNDNEALSVFPNPTAGEITIQLNRNENEIVSVCIYNLLGSLVTKAETYDLKNGTIKLNIGEENAGIYFVEIKTKEGLMSRKVVLTK